MYHYESMKPELFTDQGSRLFLQIRDRVHALLAESGAVRMQEVIAGSSGDSWEILACVDRMVELNEIREIPQEGCAARHCVFVRNL